MRTNLKHVLLTVGSTAVLLAAVGTPAQARTISLGPSAMPVGHGGADCKQQGVGWSSAPLSVTTTGQICAGATASGSACYNIRVPTSVPGWAAPFVRVTGVNGGCSWTTNHGGAVLLATTTSVRVSDPFCGPVASGTINESVAMNQDGQTWKSASPSVNLEDTLIRLAGCLGESFA